MNIFVVVHYHYQGIDVPTSLFVHEQMKAYVKQGHRVRVLVPIPYGKIGNDGKRIGAAVWNETIDGIEHFYLRYASFSNFGNKGLNSQSLTLAFKLHTGKILRDFAPDIIHAHKLGSNTDLAAAVREKAGCPLIFTTHGETNCEEPWLHDSDRIRRTAEKADQIVCVSSVLKRRLEDCGVTKPIRVILNGFNLRFAVEQKEKSPFTLVQAGYLVKRKKADITIRAFAKLRQKYPQAVLELVGHGPEMERFQALAKELHVDDATVFHGELSNKNTIERMQNARFFVMPSVGEGFGIVYLEAMASGCVTIGTQGEGISDLIVDGENGFLVPPNDPEAIVQVVEGCIRDPEKAEVVAQKGREAAIGLTWDRNAKEHIWLYRTLIGEKCDEENA